MPSEQLTSALAVIAARLESLASEDAEFREQLRQFAEAILEATADDVAPLGETPSRDVAERAPASDEAADVQPAASERGEPAPLPELTLGQAKSVAEPEPAPTPAPAPAAASADIDLALIEARSRLKAEGARWAATRQRRIRDGADFATDVEPRDRDVIARAKQLPDCFLWMCHPRGPSPPELWLYEQVAGCFDVLADAVGVVRQILNDPALHQNDFAQALDLLAEAQSGLRVAIATIEGPSDTDQLQAFAWLKDTAREQQIFIQRYMRVDDPADPENLADLAGRIEALDARVQENQRRAKRQRKMLGKVRHKSSLLQNHPDDSLEQWKILVATVDELVSDGVSPSNRDLRELLLGVVDELPDELPTPKGFQLVLREIDRFLATCTPAATPSATPSTAEMEDVARLVEGRTMVLIGGERRPASQQALKDAFRLREMIWIETREHQPIDGFEPYIARPDVAVVLLAIRWSSHSFGEVRVFCERHGKPLVRLPGGYNPNQVAAQIMAQCSERLSVR